jgi:hypothetical protein
MRTHAFVVAGLCGLAPALGAQTPSPQQRLALFEGTWRATPSEASAGGASPAAAGYARYRWAAAGRWMEYEVCFDSLAGMPRYAVVGLLGYDAERNAYAAWAFNSLGHVVAYLGHWESVSRLVFDARDVAAEQRSRVVYTIGTDSTVRFSAQRATGGDRYLPYFETVLSRTPVSGRGVPSTPGQPLCR